MDRALGGTAHLIVGGPHGSATGDLRNAGGIMRAAFGPGTAWRPFAGVAEYVIQRLITYSAGLPRHRRRGGLGTLLPVANPSDVEPGSPRWRPASRRWPPTPAAARHLAAARDRDLADLGVKVDANRAAVNALGVQTAGRFDQLDQRVDRLEGEMRTGFAEMRGKLDQAAAGQQQIVELLTGLISEQQGDQ